MLKANLAFLLVFCCYFSFVDCVTLSEFDYRAALSSGVLSADSSVERPWAHVEVVAFRVPGSLVLEYVFEIALELDQENVIAVWSNGQLSAVQPVDCSATRCHGEIRIADGVFRGEHTVALLAAIDDEDDDPFNDDRFGERKSMNDNDLDGTKKKRREFEVLAAQQTIVHADLTDEVREHRPSSPGINFLSITLPLSNIWYSGEDAYKRIQFGLIFSLDCSECQSHMIQVQRTGHIFLEAPLECYDLEQEFIYDFNMPFGPSNVEFFLVSCGRVTAHDQKLIDVRKCPHNKNLSPAPGDDPHTLAQCFDFPRPLLYDLVAELAALDEQKAASLPEVTCVSDLSSLQTTQWWLEPLVNISARVGSSLDVEEYSIQQGFAVKANSIDVIEDIPLLLANFTFGFHVKNLTQPRVSVALFLNTNFFALFQMEGVLDEAHKAATGEERYMIVNHQRTQWMDGIAYGGNEFTFELLNCDDEPSNNIISFKFYVNVSRGFVSRRLQQTDIIRIGFFSPKPALVEVIFSWEETIEHVTTRYSVSHQKRILQEKNSISPLLFDSFLLSRPSASIPLRSLRFSFSSKVLSSKQLNNNNIVQPDNGSDGNDMVVGGWLHLPSTGPIVADRCQPIENMTLVGTVSGWVEDASIRRIASLVPEAVEGLEGVEVFCAGGEELAALIKRGGIIPLPMEFVRFAGEYAVGEYRRWEQSGKDFVDFRPFRDLEPDRIYQQPFQIALIQRAYVAAPGIVFTSTHVFNLDGPFSHAVAQSTEAVLNVEECIVIGHAFTENVYHFMVESLPRLLLFSPETITGRMENGEKQKLPHIVVTGAGVFVFEILRALGVAEDRVLSLSIFPTVFAERVWLPQTTIAYRPTRFDTLAVKNALWKGFRLGEAARHEDKDDSNEQQNNPSRLLSPAARRSLLASVWPNWDWENITENGGVNSSSYDHDGNSKKRPSLLPILSLKDSYQQKRRNELHRRGQREAQRRQREEQQQQDDENEDSLFDLDDGFGNSCAPENKLRVLWISRHGETTRDVPEEGEIVDSIAASYPCLDIVIFNPTRHHPIVEKAAVVFHHADIVIGIHGAALTNVYFMRPGSLLIELNVGKPPEFACFARLAAQMSIEYVGYFVGFTRNSRSLQLDVDDLLIQLHPFLQ